MTKESDPVFFLRTFMRQGSANVLGFAARLLYCSLGNQQPLLLHREPTNKRDPNAVRLSDLEGKACGYVAQEHAPIVSIKLKAGEVLLCKTDGPCLCSERNLIIWSEGEVLEKEQKKTKARPISRVRRHVGVGNDMEQW